MQEIERNRSDESTFVDGSGTSGRGLVEALILRPNTKYLLIDEIDKMKKDQVIILYNVLETGRLQQNKKRFVVDQMFEGQSIWSIKQFRKNTKATKEQTNNCCITRIYVCRISGNYKAIIYKEVTD